MQFHAAHKQSPPVESKQLDCCLLPPPWRLAVSSWSPGCGESRTCLNALLRFFLLPFYLFKKCLILVEPWWLLFVDQDYLFSTVPKYNPVSLSIYTTILKIWHEIQCSQNTINHNQFFIISIFTTHLRLFVMSQIIDGCCPPLKFRFPAEKSAHTSFCPPALSKLYLYLLTHFSVSISVLFLVIL